MTIRSDPAKTPPYIVGVDVGGTKIAASLVDARGQIICNVRQPTDISNPEATLDSIAATVDRVIQNGGLSRGDVQAIGLGIPGLVDPQNGIGIASVNLNWQNVKVKMGIEKRVGLPCAIENDVKAAALGEARYGAGKGLSNLIFLSIGTGISSAFISDKKIYRGPNGMAGEIGHTVLERGGVLCKCGGHGCFEALASGPAIAARAARKIRGGRTSLMLQTSGANTIELTGEAVFQAASQGDEVAVETLEEVCEYIAIAIQFLALAFDPQIVVLGGGVAQAGKPFVEPVKLALGRLAEESWVFAKIYSASFVQVTQLGGDIGMLGAAALVAPN